MNKRRGLLRRMWDNLAARTIAYYVVLVGVVTLLWLQGPPGIRRLLIAPAGDISFLEQLSKSAAAAAIPPGPIDGPFAQTMRTAVAMLVAALLALPVSWLYILTRHKKGFRQSMVHTLIMLPVVVSGVMVLVKTSLALAFALAGVVAAVRFRNTLEESKDAVYIFLATALGLAAGVDPPVALAISLIYNAIIMTLWFTDFGRTAAVFEGAVAEQRLEQARQFAGRQSSFITKLDDAILKDLSPEQLDVLADRAGKRRRQATDEQQVPDEDAGYDVLLRVRTLNDMAARGAVEPVLDELLKKWRFSGMSKEGDVVVLEYALRLKRKMTPNTLRDAVHAAQCPDIMGIEIH
ncbi:MAG: hypothetical protein A2W29_13915 [Gemmatimonadetes bacterium RBG_16_66_8]|nr:MAG: hypothetical protein A2W29_13915 [Gemmatimonadetes bacterium RBG_16_66_8]